MDNSNKYSFISDVAHGIRTPMNVIWGNCELIQQEQVNLKVREYAQDIKSASKQLLDVVNDALDIVRLDEKVLELIEEEYNFLSVINECAAYVRSIAKEKELECIVNYDKELPYKLYGDRRRITQIMKKLLQNAVQSTKKGSITIDVGFKALENMKVELIITVTDTGAGILSEEMKLIFGLADRTVNTNKKRSIEGTGISLVLSKGLAGLMGGDITVEARYREGTAYTARVIQETIGISTIEDHIDDSDLSGFDVRIPFKVTEAKALIVDDNIINAKVAAHLMKQYGLDTDIADNGESAVSLIQRIHYDLIFMDHMMPDLDGTDITKIIREMVGFSMEDIQHLKQVPIIVLTANTELGAEEMFIREGMNDYLPKPIEIKNLERILRTWLPESRIQYETEFDIKSSGLTQLFISLGINYKEALENLEGNLDEYNSVLYSFFKNGPANIKALRTAMENKDYTSFLITLRGILGVLQTIGADNLYYQGRELETACKEEKSALFESETIKLIEEYRKVLEALRNFIPEDEEYKGEKAVISKDELVKLLRNLISVIQEYQIDEATQMFYELAQRSYEDDDIMEQLHNAENDFINSFKYTEVIDTLTKVINKLKNR